MSLVDSFLGKLQRITYKQPRQVYGSEALHVLNKLIDNGVNLRGGKDNLGFLFIYELLTGAGQSHVIVLYVLRSTAKVSDSDTPLCIIAIWASGDGYCAVAHTDLYLEYRRIAQPEDYGYGQYVHAGVVHSAAGARRGADGRQPADLDPASSHLQPAPRL
jgi:hypothetical protein